MNSCLKSISLINLTTHIDNFNEGMINFLIIQTLNMMNLL